ncbi:sugar ABC transporter substrate-binding protein [Paraburkholderia sediminicola]|uniref:sugar ABC transporter substrate-binding protein n=1 Tax=Paraburkholderia sediminicola TaxID=458836 RepID=UPI0038BA571C
MKSRAWLVVLSALLFLTGWARADGLDDPHRAPYYNTFKGKKVAFVPLSMGFDLTDGWAALWKRQADTLGYTFTIRDPNWNTQAGAQAIESLINENPKPDIIIIQNPDIQSYARLAKRAQQAGIYVLQINMNSAADTEAYAGPDWVALGEDLGNAMVRRCGKGSGKSGKIAVLQGPLTAAASVFQIKGVMNVLAKHPELKLVSNQAAEWDASKAHAIAQTVLQQNRDLCGFIGFWDGQDIGAAAAVREAGMSGKVAIATSAGGVQTSCDNIAKGNFTDVVSLDVRGEARDINTMISFLLQAKPKPGTLSSNLYIHRHMITPENMKPGDCYVQADLSKP